MNADIPRILAAVWPHVHDISVSALAAAVVTLGVVILLELRSVLKLRHVVDNSLARVFEQLDLLRFESQQLIEGQQLIEARAQAGAASPAWRAEAPARPQAQAQTDDARAAVSPAAASVAAAAVAATAGEARLLSSLAQARARREASGAATAVAMR